MLSQFVRNQPTRKNKRMLGELHDFAPGTMAIGRLDEHSEGLLLLTTDGHVSYEVRSAKWEKEYYVRVLGEVKEAALDQLRTGVDIQLSGQTYRTKPCAVRLLDPATDFSFPPRRPHTPNHGPVSWVSVTLREGKNRQVRRMLAAVGHPVIRLVRVRIGEVLLGQMGVGEVADWDGRGVQTGISGGEDGDEVGR